MTKTLNKRKHKGGSTTKNKKNEQFDKAVDLMAVTKKVDQAIDLLLS